MSEDNNEIEDTKDELRRELERWDDESLDEHEREVARLRAKHILDQNSIRKTGYREGWEEGIRIAIEEGSNNKAKEIAKKMLRDGFDKETISEYTGLSKSEIDNIKI